MELKFDKFGLSNSFKLLGWRAKCKEELDDVVMADPAGLNR